jgi:hypothetical protein
MPLRRRPVDLAFVVFFAVNFVFVTYIIDLEAIVRPATVWPPAPLVEVIHWYGTNYDPLLMANPPFWQATMWIDVVFFGPFYLFAIYAFAKRRNWIRVPALVWAGTMLANVTIILFEERFGQWAAPDFGLVVLANLAWLLVPLATIWRMRKEPFPT